MVQDQQTQDQTEYFDHSAEYNNWSDMPKALQQFTSIISEPPQVEQYTDHKWAVETSEYGFWSLWILDFKNEQALGFDNQFPDMPLEIISLGEWKRIMLEVNGIDIEGD